MFGMVVIQVLLLHCCCPDPKVAQSDAIPRLGNLKGPMILRCVKKATSYKCPYVIAIVVPDQIYTVVMMTICANQENNIV